MCYQKEGKESREVGVVRVHSFKNHLAEKEQLLLHTFHITASTVGFLFRIGLCPVLVLFFISQTSFKIIISMICANIL